MSDAPKETKSMQSISNETVCLYFYYVFLVVAIMAASSSSTCATARV